MDQFKNPSKYVEKILLNEKTILQRVQELGKQITKDYQNKDVLLICVLKGALVFFADLIRDINIHFDFDFVQLSSYGNSTQSSGNIVFLRKPLIDINDRDILVVDDILDSGLTLSYLKSYLLSKNPSSLKICVLLNKVSHRIQPIEVDYIGFNIPDEFVVGYGLDFNDMYRGLRYIAVLKDEN